VSAYIASTYQLLKNSPEAEKIINYYQLNAKSNSSDFYNTDIAFYNSSNITGFAR